MNILHVSAELGFRGGEHQTLLLVETKKPGIVDWSSAPAGSGLAERLMQQDRFVPARCKGFLDFKSSWSLTKTIREKHIDILHAHSNKAHKTAAIAKLFQSSIPLVVTRRNAFPTKSSPIHRITNHFITISSAGRQALLSAGVNAGRISVIPDAVDEEQLNTATAERFGFSNDDTLIVCVAAMTGEKDHEALLKAWALVIAQTPSARLLLIGDGPLRPNLESRFGELDRVHFLGNQANIGGILKGADIVTLTSNSEGLGSILCAAQWLGKPVVATRAGGIPEAVEDRKTALLCDVGDYMDLASKLLTLSGDKDLQCLLGDAAQPRARKLFSLETVIAQHVAVYSRLTGS